MLFDLPEEVKDIRDAVREFAEKEIRPVADEYHEKKEFPMDIVKKAAKLGYIAAYIPEEYGGVGAGVLADNVIKEEVARVDPGFGMAFYPTIGTKAILRSGNEEQKHKYLPKIAKGEMTTAFALTEPGGGSDVAGLQTSAKETKDGFLINGTKTFISNAPFADLFVVAARTGPDRYRGITLFLVEGDREGIERTTLDIIPGFSLSQTGEVVFNDVDVPKENILGELNNGFYHTMKWLDGSRSIIGALCLGYAQGAFDLALNYAKTREQFGKKL
ncbi:MAG: acyl-CoA dehydrogenase family protein, partial [Candidatus Syntropharchaeia archaeon]